MGGLADSEHDALRKIGDCVYFLMFEGWKNELQSNRWHWASRWARHLPVVLVQPVHRSRRPYAAESEPRIPGCRVLEVPASQDASNLMLHASTIEHVVADLRRKNHSRPILWAYNPHLLATYAALPAALRVFHATENFFDFGHPPGPFLRAVRGMVLASDLIVAVSSGVAEGIAENVAGQPIEVVTNGCDFAAYSAGGRDPMIEAVKQEYGRVAVYGGNINSRIDFDLLGEASAASPETAFIFIGPTHGLHPEDQRRWERLGREKNVRVLGPMPAARLPHVYKSADVGLIPYKQIKLVVDNGFPLKALEMCASGLPVVSTRMNALVDLAPALFVCASREEFLTRLATVDRTQVDDDVKEASIEVARLNDYDVKFVEVVRRLAALGPPARTTTTRIDTAFEVVGVDWTASLGQVRIGRIGRLIARLQGWSIEGVGRVPPEVRAVVPLGLRRRLVNALMRTPRI
jgi:glycosyltransferase involved in cell wall biosynthesis